MKYRHFKGAVYEILATGRHSETNEELVVYRGEDGMVWARPKEMFFGDVTVEGKTAPRFRPI